MLTVAFCLSIKRVWQLVCYCLWPLYVIKESAEMYLPLTAVKKNRTILTMRSALLCSNQLLIAVYPVYHELLIVAYIDQIFIQRDFVSGKVPAVFTRSRFAIGRFLIVFVFS